MTEEECEELEIDYLLYCRLSAAGLSDLEILDLLGGEDD